MLELMNGLRSVIEVCKVVQPGEQVLVVADDDGASKWMGELIMGIANSMGAEAVLAMIKARENTGAKEPPAAVAAAMKTVNSIIRVTDEAALVHSNARKEATAAGARYYIIHPAEAEQIRKGIAPAEIHQVSQLTRNLAQRLTQADNARITTQFGTDITMSLTGREGLASEPASDGIAGIPFYGEAAISPVEGTAQGIIVVDLAIVHWKHLLREPLHLTVKSGKVTDVSGSSPDSVRLRQMITTDENASNIAELGIGTSHIIPFALQGDRRDAGRLGTVHIGIGRNNDIGGATWSRMHLDALMDRVTIELDGEWIMRDGSLLI